MNGLAVSRILYAVSTNHSDAGGDVYQSSDGGQTWVDISTSVTDVSSGQALAHQAYGSSIDSADNLYIPENYSTDGAVNAYWKYSAGVWTRTLVGAGIVEPIASVLSDPIDSNRIYVSGITGSLSRSDNAGASWQSFGLPQFANSQGWLPQITGTQNKPIGHYCNGGIHIDAQGNLWLPEGDEGMLTLAAEKAQAGTASNPPSWTVKSSGIEEMVAMDATVPPGSNDTLIVTTLDTGGFVVQNPDTLSAFQIPLQHQYNSDGMSVDYAPDVPSYIVFSSSWIPTVTPDQSSSDSGYSTDGGKTWNHFQSAINHTDPVFNSWYALTYGYTEPIYVPAGQIAVSKRGNRTLGSDHLVVFPAANPNPSPTNTYTNNGFAPLYSHDGGATWTVTSSFALAPDNVSLANNGSYIGDYIFWSAQHLLKSDPFIEDKFYLKMTSASGPESLFVSTDGGVTWVAQANANLPNAFDGQLEVNHKVPNDLWFAGGYEYSNPSNGQSGYGLYHSIDGGKTFQVLPSVQFAALVAIGAASGNPNDASYSIYFYGLMNGDTKWGIFRSTNGGTSWTRIVAYPVGIYDVPRVMTASQDTYGKVFVGFGGNSFVYGELK